VPISSDLLNDCLDGLLRREMFLIEKQSPHIVRACDAIMDNHARAPRTSDGRPRTQKIMAGDTVERDGRRGQVVSTDEGFARVCWENPACGWTWADFKTLEVVR
jgi:hypothetical protein